MPLASGKSRKTIESNFDEVRHGKTFQRTAKKYGKKKAVKQMQAIVLSKARESGNKRHHAKKRVAGKR